MSIDPGFRDEGPAIEVGDVNLPYSLGQTSSLCHGKKDERSNWARFVVGFFFRNPVNIEIIRNHIVSLFEALRKTMRKSVVRMIHRPLRKRISAGCLERPKFMHRISSLS
jgi:hypothetical protein